MASQDYWTKGLADVLAGRRTDVTRKGTGPIPTFDAWKASSYQPATYTGSGRTQFDDYGNSIGRTPGLQTGGSANPAEYDYLNEFYNLPSYAGSGNFLERVFHNGPLLAAAGLGGLAGAYGSTLGAGEAVGFGGGFGEGAGLGGSVDSGFFPEILNESESFLDPWDMQADPTIMNQPNYIEDFAQGVPLSVGGDNLSSLSRLLMGTNAQGGANGVGDILGNLLGNRGLLGTGLALAPSLAAIAYAKNQGPFDTSRLESAYDQIDPNSLALPYDQQSARGRSALTSSLTQRGVMGSSFANQDLAGFDMMRHAGRQNILTSGAQAQAGIGGQILDAQVKERALKNDLYGRALLALSTGLNPPQTNISVGGTRTGETDIMRLLGLGGGLSNLFT